MANVQVEITGDARKLEATFAKIEQGQAKVGTGFQGVAESGRDSARQIEAANEAAATKGAGSYSRILAELKRHGPEGRDQARAIEGYLQEAGKGGRRSMAEIIEELGEIDPAAVAAAQKIQAEMAEADRQSDFRETLASLAALGGDASLIAAGIREDLDRAAKESAGDMDQILAKLREIDPTVAQSAERVKAELAEASRFGEGKFEETLAKLRSMGPTGRVVATELKTHLVNSGQLVEESIDDVIAKIREIDPAAADAATAIQANMTAAAEESGSSFDAFTGAAITKLAAVAGGYIGIQQAIGKVTEYLQAQDQLLQSSLAKQLQLAAAQQEAAKNLAAYTAVERDELLQRAVPEIMRETGFSDQNAVTIALGTAASSGADSEQAREAVAASARMNRLTPENLSGSAIGAVGIMKATGLEDAREAIGLLQTAGAESKITESGALTKSLPVALANTVGTVRNQDSTEAARQAAALFAQITQGGNDTQGETSATFATNLSKNLNNFFGDLEKQRVDARSEMERLQRKDNPLENERMRMQQLERIIPALEKATDPETLFGRIEALQQSPELSKEFIGAGFGDARFNTVLRDLFDPASEAAEGLQQRFQNIQASVEFFETQAAAQSNMTPQMVNATATSAVTAAINAQQAFDSDAATQSNVRQITEDVIAATNQGGVAGFFDRLTSDRGIGIGGLGGTGAGGEAIGALTFLQGRQRQFARDGIDELEAPRVETLDIAIQQIENLLIGQAQSGALSRQSIESAAERATAGVEAEQRIRREGPQSPEALELSRRNEEQLNRIATVLEQLLDTNKQTARNTRNRPNTGEAIRGAAAGADARAPRR